MSNYKKSRTYQVTVLFVWLINHNSCAFFRFILWPNQGTIITTPLSNSFSLISQAPHLWFCTRRCSCARSRVSSLLSTARKSTQVTNLLSFYRPLATTSIDFGRAQILRELASRLANPFGHPMSQVRRQVLVLQSCVDFRQYIWTYFLGTCVIWTHLFLYSCCFIVFFWSFFCHCSYCFIVCST